MLDFIFTFVIMVLVTIGHPLKGTAKNEPMCSKFDYEEKLLEKVIRMEIKMEKILEEVKDKERNIMSLSADLSQRAGDVEKSAMQFHRDVNKTMVGFDDTFKEEMTKLIALEDTLSLPIVAFNVRLSSTKTVTKGNKIVYDTEITNQGRRYDKSTGIFTAPYNGLYHFSAHVCNKGNNAVHYAMYREGTPLTNSVQYDINNVYSCSSVSTFVVVSKGERIWVQCTHGSCILYYDSHRWNTFTGSLVK